MSDFFTIFKAGFYDFVFLNIFGHLLFVVAISGIYTLKSWKMVYSFMMIFVGSYLVTFLLSVFHILTIPADFLRLLIPITVVITAFLNFWVKKGSFTNRYPSQNYRYYIALAGGLIHGFAFAKGVKGKTFLDILAYNAGLTTCIMLSVFFLLLLAYILVYFLRVRLREWNLIISGACAGVAMFKIFLNLY